MKALTLSIALAASSLFMTTAHARGTLTQAGNELTTVSCTWSNGDHFSFTSNNDAFIDSMIAHCMDTGGTAQWN